MHRHWELIEHPGNEDLRCAAGISLQAAALGWPLHLHVQGPRGTGKTSLLRALAAVLPPVERVRGCVYNCDPVAPHCPQHRDMTAAELAAIGTEWVPTPFLEISHAAKTATVVGSVDLARLAGVERPEAALLPGTLPRAHRGVVLVDEINRLADTTPELADILLDAMGTRPGRVQIEEAGLATVLLPLSVTVWATSNPDEEPGPLHEVRRQLADRFDLVVEARRPPSVDWVERILERSAQRWASGAAPQTAAGVGAGAAVGAAAGAAVLRPGMPSELRRDLAMLFCRFELESLRAVEGWQAAAVALAAREQRSAATAGDLRRVAPWVLAHRVSTERLGQMLRWLEAVALAPECHPAPVSEPDPLSRPMGVVGSAPASPAAAPPAAAPSASGPAGPVSHPAFNWWQRLRGRAPQQGTAGIGPGAQSAFSVPARPLHQLQPGQWVRPEDEA